MIDKNNHQSRVEIINKIGTLYKGEACINDGRSWLKKILLELLFSGY